MKKVVSYLMSFSLLLHPLAAWQVTMSGNRPYSLNMALAVKADPEGHVIAGGWLFNSGTAEDFAVVKLNGATGEEMWRLRINGSFNGRDQVNDLAIDSEGNVIAVGTILNRGTSWDFFVVKIEGQTGREIWRAEINGTANREDEARAVTLDAEGNAVVVGEIRNVDTGYDFAVVKLEGETGHELWRVEISGTFPLSDDRANAVAIDPQGYVLVAGYTQNMETGYDVAVIKIEGTTGEVIWHVDIDSGDRLSDTANALAVDSEGNAIVAGVLWHQSSLEDFAVLKLDGKTGMELWRKAVDGSQHIVDIARDVTVDASGHVVAGGFVYNIGTEQDFFVIKLDGKTGEELWRTEMNGSNDGFDQAWRVAIDGNGNVIVGGVMDNLGTSLDFVILRLDGETGKEISSRTMNGRGNGPDWLQAVTIDNQGDILAAGAMALGPTFSSGSDFTVIKLTGKSLLDF